MKTPDDVRNAVLEMDPNIKSDEDSFNAACVCLASVVVGPSITKVATFLELPRSKVSLYGYRLRRSKVWRGRKVYANWDNKETGGIEFWGDVNVALGFMEKR